jgi:transcriptional regulator of acetoin/glycerol metabolism
LVAGLTQHRGNVAALARELGVHREQVHRRLRRFAIDPTRFRG